MAGRVAPVVAGKPPGLVGRQAAQLVERGLGLAGQGVDAGDLLGVAQPFGAAAQLAEVDQGGLGLGDEFGDGQG